MAKIDYVVVEGTQKGVFENEVEKHMRLGYKTVGGVCVTQNLDFPDTWHYHQAMLLIYDKEE